MIFNCPTMRELDPVDLTEAGVVKRVRGVAYTMRVSPLVRNSPYFCYS